MSPASSAAPLLPDHLTDAELAKLAGYETAPERSSPYFKHFDEAAQQAQKSWRWLFLVSVLLLLGISFFSAATGLGPWLATRGYIQPTQTRLVDIVGVGLTLVGVLLEVGLQVYWRRRLSPWSFYRDHAEALRSAVWLYLFGLPLFRTAQPLTAAETDAQWRHLLQGLAGDTQRHRAVTRQPPVSLPASSDEPTPQLKQRQQRLSELSFAERLRAYCAARLSTQQTYFLKRAKELQQDSIWWTRISYTLLAAALAWNIVRLVYIIQNNTVVMQFFNFNFFLVIIASVGLVKAYQEAEDMEALAVRYQRMADRLSERVADQPPAPVSAEAFQHFITESERMLRDETTEWTTRRSESIPAAPHAITLGFVGKRKLPGGEAPLRAALAAVLNQLEREYPGPAYELVGLSALALGADIVFAEVVAQRGAATPTATHPAYAQLIFLPAPPAEFFLPADFQLADEESAAVVQARLARAEACQTAATVQEVRIVGTSADRNERFAEAAFAIVDGCDLLLVACTQADKAAALAEPPATDLARGGSAETLQYARAHGKRLILIEVDAPTGPTGELLITTMPARG